MAAALTAAPAQLRLWPWPLVVAATTYVGLATVDVKLGPVPLKWLLTVAAVAAWAASAARRAEVRRSLWLFVAAVAVLLPAFGVAVALVRHAADDPAQAHSLSDALEVASRFAYVALALPIAGWAQTARPQRRHDLWLVPAVALCAVTLGLLTASWLGAHYGPSGQVGPFKGTIAKTTTGELRIFLINDVLLVPVLLLALVRVRLAGASATGLGLLAALIASVYLSHTRGLWLGVVAGSVVVLVLTLPRNRIRRLVAAPLAVLALVAVIPAAAPQVSRPVVDAVTQGDREVSAASRLTQGPQLVDGARAHLVLGSGMGAWLPSGYRRSPQTPWSFELTYLQLLFELGVIGLAAFLATVAGPAVGAWRRAITLGSAAGPETLAGAAGVVGLAFVCAGNPYLVTSPGTFALGVVAVWCLQPGSRSTSTNPDRGSSESTTG